MTADDRYDVLVIGAGQGGIPLSWALAGRGRRVAIAERHQVGGSCVNFGCTPTKAAVASARIAFDARRAGEFGVRVGGVSVDFPAVIARARSIAAESRTGIERGYQGSDNPRLVRGHARLAGRDGDRFVVSLGERRLAARDVVINTGNRTSIPDTPGLGDVPYLHAGNWLEHDRLPSHLLVLGAGVIALEMGQFYRRMGSRVTILERGDRVAPREEPEVADAFRRRFEAEGVEFRFRTTVARFERTADGVRARLEGPDGPSTIEGSHLFVATGRRPNTDDLGLETVGLETERGIVPVDERLRTPVPGLWAAGDVRGGPQFTHTSWDDHRVLLSQMTGDGSRTTRRIVPYGIYTHPELGRVGITEEEALARGVPHEVHRYDMARSGRAHEMGDDEGFIKLVVEPGAGRILGATVFADHGSELVHLYVDLMNAGAPAGVLRDAVHAHPTLAEAAQSAVSA